MPATSSRADPSVVADVFSDSAVSAAPLSDREQKRWLRLRVWLWGKQFAVRLKSNALWMKQFLHGSS